MNQHPTLRLTPSNSPYLRTTAPKLTTRTSKSEEVGLRLHKVIGTTTASSNGFDCLPSTSKFAYIAGAAAVLATVDQDLSVTQHFFRARPSLLASARDTAGPWPTTPTPNEARSRALGHVRESNAATSPLGFSGREWLESPTGKSSTAKDRIKAATSVALSPNGKWLAIGETGYRPRIVLFRAADGTSDSPVASVSEHTFGVHALSFSPDSKHLASLGTVNDGFLYIWAIDDRSGAATLYASNKCTNLINSLAWIGRSVVTVGLRVVKVWRPDEETTIESRMVDMGASTSTPRLRADNKTSEYANSILSPRHKPLAGKNSLLGDMLDANFVCLVPISDSKAFVCAESGEVCLLDDSEKTQSLTVVATAGFRITAARMDEQGSLHVAGSVRRVKKFDPSELQMGEVQPGRLDRRKTISPVKPSCNDGATITAIATIGAIVVELDSRRGIRLTRDTDDDEDNASKEARQLPAHGDTVLGVRNLTSAQLPDASFFTFSGNGTVQVWNSQGDSVASLRAPIDTSPDMYGTANELKAAAALFNGSLLVAGDRYGTLTVVDIKSNAVLAQVRAHSTEIVDIMSFERPGVSIVATAGRDRTVQLFAWADGKLDLVQTMDEHAGAVTGILFTNDGQRLLSCSADRTVVVREAMFRDGDDPAPVAYVIRRTITLKSAPTSMCLGAHNDAILVATTDRTIGNYNIKNGQVGFSFKCADSDGGEAVAMAKVLFAPSLNNNPTIIGASSSDKSVRLYSEFGSLIARDWGHTEGITDIALLAPRDDSGYPETASVVTVAADSTIFMWDTTPLAANGVRPPSEDGAAETPIIIKPVPMGPPLRKVLSYSELTRLRLREKSVDENGSTSPDDAQSPVQPPPPPSPQRLRKKPSRTSVAQPPRLEPAFRTGGFASPRRRSFRQRSPSPPSPRNAAKRDTARRPSLGVSLRAKSSDNLLTTGPGSVRSHGGPGSLTGSTEALCRTLHAYRKKLAASAKSDTIAPDPLRELDKELKLTARVLNEKSQGKTVDEAMMARLLSQASEKIVGMLDERIKERVESEVRRSGEPLPPLPPLPPARPGMPRLTESPVERAKSGPMDAVLGAFEKVALDE